MNIVLDTNIMVAGLLTPFGPCDVDCPHGFRGVLVTVSLRPLRPIAANRF
jgi:predicted nucleic acid-binding protein